MDSKNLSQYKTELEKQKANLLEQIASHSTPEIMGNDVDSGDEETDEAEEQGNRLAIAQGLREDLTEIETALEKIQRGTYGICERCGKTIETEVLATAPESAMCRACKQIS
ncbi:MAG: hypothetical protein FJY98_00990 [Candidatus Liptonbacteria bacterium]|nr:hypothetical protein [Candidatus Liptonbacteria bacterium]